MENDMIVSPQFSLREEPSTGLLPRLTESPSASTYTKALLKVGCLSLYESQSHSRDLFAPADHDVCGGRFRERGAAHSRKQLCALPYGKSHGSRKGRDRLP